MAQRRSKSFLDQVRKLGPGLLVSGATLFTPPGISAAGAIDAVGAALVDSVTIDFTYDPIGKTITAGTINGVTASAVLTDNAIVRGDGGVRGVQSSGAYVDDSARLLVGNATAVTVALTSALQVLGTTDDTAAMTFARWSANAGGPSFVFGKSRNAAINGNTIVSNGDVVGTLSFQANNGSTYLQAGAFQCRIDNTPGAADMPGRFVWALTQDGASTSTDHMTLKNTGTLLLGTTTETASSGRVQLADHTTAAGGLLFGTDTNLYRQAASSLRTDDNLSAITLTARTNTSNFAGVSEASFRAWVSGTTPGAQFTDSSRSANDRIVDLEWNGGSFLAQFVNDVYGAATRIFTATGGHASGFSLFAIPVATSTVIGHTASVTVGNAGKLQVSGATAAASQSQVSGYAADATTAGTIALSKSRNATNGSNTIVQSGDVVGRIIGYGANGTTYTNAAQISMEIDGTPGATNDMPGRLVISTTPDASGTLTEALRVDSAQKTIFQVDRAVRFNNQTSAAGANAGTLGNAPTAGDPGYWLKINIGGTNYAIPAWAG